MDDVKRAIFVALIITFAAEINKGFYRQNSKSTWISNKLLGNQDRYKV